MREGQLIITKVEAYTGCNELKELYWRASAWEFVEAGDRKSGAPL